MKIIANFYQLRLEDETLDGKIFLQGPFCVECENVVMSPRSCDGAR